MKKLAIIITLFCLHTSIQGQTAMQDLVSTSGESNKNSVYQLDWSVGEVTTDTYSNSSNILTQGFQQGKLTVTSIGQLENSLLEINVFPNPTSDFVILKFKSDNTADLTYTLTDVQGKILQSSRIKDIEDQISMSNQIVGTYFLIVQSENRVIKTFKIIKSN